MANDPKPPQKDNDLTGLMDLGLMDHAPAPAPIKKEPINESTVSIDHNALTATLVIPDEVPAEIPTHVQDLIQEDILADHLAEIQTADQTESYLKPDHLSETISETILAEPDLASSNTSDITENLKSYSESILTHQSLDQVSYPFHLKAQGVFGIFERDHLLRFITDFPIGISSQELDLQIQSGRIFMPRISEFAGIKLIQTLRDSGLHFEFYPADRDPDDTRSWDPVTRITDNTFQQSITSLPVLHDAASDRLHYQTGDSIVVAQFLKANMLEVEKSDIFQDVLTRLRSALHAKARLKGADAISEPVTEIMRLRLPSEYQVILKAQILHKK